jgi:hypothetical protein
MGVLTDYFRAPSVAHVQQLMTETDGGPVLTADPATTVYDGVESKFIDTSVILGQLISLIRDEPWTPRTVDDRLIWPDDPSSPDGPWVVVLDDRTRDTLADVPAARVPALAESWATVEEFHGHADAPFLGGLVTELSALAGRAREAGEPLFCWISL